MAKKIALVVLGIAVVVGIYSSGVHEQLTVESIKSLLTENGIWGPVLFVVLYMLGELVTIPSVFFVIAAGLAWPFWQAATIAWVASVNSAVMVFLFYRYLAREAVQSRLPDKWKDLDSRLRRGAVLPIAMIRLVAFLAPWTHPALAVTSVSLRDYTLGTAIGIIPGVVLLVLFGDGVSKWFQQIPGWVWALVLGVIVTALVTRALIVKRRKRAASPAATE